MAQLKDIKTRLQTVKSTQKITSAMMLVASAKLRKTLRMFSNLQPYKEGLGRIYNILLAQTKNFHSPLIDERPVKRVAIVVFSSNAGLAGRFNHLVSAELLQAVDDYKSLGESNILLYSVGDRGVKELLKRGGVHHQGNFQSIADRPTLANVKLISEDLIDKFIKKEIDRVELIHQHFITKGTQVMLRETLLPLKAEKMDVEPRENIDEYIVEPDAESILTELTSKLVHLRLLDAHIDSLLSEHVARMTAMQIATENAEDLIDDLTLEYNKLRQYAITAELLDIIGGSFGR